jgi:hypothetical protein
MLDLAKSNAESREQLEEQFCRKAAASRESSAFMDHAASTERSELASISSSRKTMDACSNAARILKQRSGNNTYSTVLSGSQGQVCRRSSRMIQSRFTDVRRLF